MRLIVAGGRDLTSQAHRMLTWDAIQLAEASFEKRTSMVVCGMATGIDRHGYDWAKEGGIDISEHPARWDELGSAAGPARNREMAKVADAALVVWDGKSKGSRNMIETARNLLIPVLSVKIENL